MCVMTSLTMATIGSAVASSLTSAAAAASAVGSGIVSGMGMLGSGLASMGSAVASGASAVGSSIASGASATWGAASTAVEAIGSGISSGISTVTAPFTGAYAAGASAAGEMGSGLAMDGALVGSTEAAALNAGAEASMLMGMADSGVALTAENTALAAQGAKAAADGSVLAKAAGATAGLGGLGKVGIAAAQIGGGAVESVGAYNEAKDNAANLKAMAKNAELQAAQEIESAEIEARDLSRKQRQAIGQGRVAAAANGVMLEGRAESAPAMWEQDMQAEAAWDREKLMYNANIKANALYDQANIYSQQASAVRSSGNLRSASALLRGGIGAGVTLYGNPSATLFA